MSDTAPRRWQRWRVALVDRTTRTDTERFVRRPLLAATPLAEAPTAVEGDGIRHDLVARVRREIEAGTYDTEEKWLAAEELLIRNIGRR